MNAKVAHPSGAERVRRERLPAPSPAFAFETDRAGRLTFLWPPDALGWPAGSLIGGPAAALLARPAGPDPFAAGVATAARPALGRHATGEAVWLSVSAAPAPGPGGGMRGVAHCMAGQDGAPVAAQWRGEVVERILRQVRQEVLASRMMQAVLEGVAGALDGEGGVVLDLLDQTAEPVRHAWGVAPGPLLPRLIDGLQADAADPILGMADGRALMLCPTYTRFGGRAGLCLWRAPGAAAWTSEDARLVSPILTVVRMVLEHEAIQRELALQARTDALTGVHNRRAFLEEVARRIDRLHHEGQPGTLVIVALDHLKRLNDASGQEAGDRALVTLATLLRRTTRPADIVARLGGGEFALWLDGSDALTAAERADDLCRHAPAALAAALPEGAPPLGASVGIAARHPAHAEALDQVMRRADRALGDAKRAGGGQWRAAPGPCEPG